MREVDISEAAARFDELIDEVERGATICITQNGRLLTRIVPEEQAHKNDAAGAS